MRYLGYDKTPDVKLDVPFATKDGAIINWIECKARFGDDEVHEEHLEQQLRPYWRRFGTGLVIYWFGFISDLRISALKEGILVEDSFPSEQQIILMNPTYDIYDEIPSEDDRLDNFDKNGHVNVNDCSVKKDEVNSLLEVGNKGDLSSEISSLTKSIEIASID